MFYKGMPRPEDSGVKKGMKFNTKKKSVNTAILETFDRLGGVDTFVKWANDSKCPQNKREFYKIFSKLARPVLDNPINIDNGNGGSMTLTLRIKDQMVKDPSVG